MNPHIASTRVSESDSNSDSRVCTETPILHIIDIDFDEYENYSICRDIIPILIILIPPFTSILLFFFLIIYII